MAKRRNSRLSLNLKLFSKPSVGRLHKQNCVGNPTTSAKHVETLQISSLSRGLCLSLLTPAVCLEYVEGYATEVVSKCH